MSVKTRFTTAAAAASLILGAGIAVATSGTANAVTPSCGNNCIDVFSHNFGDFAHPNFVVDAYKRGQSVGTPVILFRVSNSDPGEDFTVSEQGTVHDFFVAGLVSSAVALKYGGGAGATANPAIPNLSAWEVEYAPFGADTGLCVGVAATAVSGEKVTLQPCGVSSKTVWIDDSTDSPSTASVPFINGSDTNFSHPLVATYPGGSYPTDTPRPQLYVTNLTGFSNGSGPELGTVSDTQLWAFDFGVQF